MMIITIIIIIYAGVGAIYTTLNIDIEYYLKKKKTPRKRVTSKNS